MYRLEIIRDPGGTATWTTDNFNAAQARRVARDAIRGRACSPVMTQLILGTSELKYTGVTLPFSMRLEANRGIFGQ